MHIEFNFILDQKVFTPFGDAGIISMLGFDDGGKSYYVKTKDGGNWFKESQLGDDPKTVKYNFIEAVG